MPAALGTLAVLLSCASFHAYPLTPWAFFPLAAGSILLLLNLVLKLPTAALAAATLSLIAGLAFLVPPPIRIHPALAAACGTLVGLLAAKLSRIALRARRAKQLH